MSLDYQSAAQFAQTWGLFYVMGLFGLVLAYALWPKNKATFDRAAQMPLQTDDDDHAEQTGERRHG